MKNLLLANIIALLSANNTGAQTVYIQNLKTYQADYVAKHEVVKRKDEKYFRFFAIDSTYLVAALFEKVNDSIGFTMKTSGAITKHYYKYGKLAFNLKDTLLKLFIYQSRSLMQQPGLKDYLFIPFTDFTTGDASYGSGRYLDFIIGDIKNNMLVLDFNKAYNPYCAYTTGFNCPIPPKENYLPVTILAGEKVFAKPVH